LAGGGIYNTGTLSITASTLSDNYASGRYHAAGGGIFNSGTLSITASTFSDNFAEGLNLPEGLKGGAVSADGSAASVVSVDSIFHNGTVLVGGGATFRSLGHNLFSDKPAFGVDRTDRIKADPRLGPLADNGGPTMTMALLPGSPALDAGSLVAGITTDQRGIPRPQGAAPDIGAFEARGFTLAAPRGVRYPNTVVLTFSQPMDAVRAEDTANYSLVWAGRDHRFGTRDDRVIGIRQARYDPGRHAVTLRPMGRLSRDGAYVLTVVHAPPGSLTNARGVYPAGKGRSGGAFVVYLGPE
jgi:hypothetical protein